MTETSFIAGSIAGWESGDGPDVLFLHGSPMPLSQGEQTAALIPGAEVKVIPAAGHLPWYERPGCVAAALAAVYDRAREADTTAG